MHTVFEDYNPNIPIVADWLNDVDTMTYFTVPALQAEVGVVEADLAAVQAQLPNFVVKSVLAAPQGVQFVGNGAWFSSTVLAFDATNCPDGAAIMFRGRSAVLDGGGGVFTYSKASTQTVDNGTVFAPAAGGGRLFRSGWTVVGFNGDLIPRWFGAKGDNVTDDSVALQNTITMAFAGPSSQTINLSGAQYRIGSPLVYPAGGGVTLVNGAITALSGFSSSRYLIECQNQSGGLVHHDLKFDNITLDANFTGGCLVVDNYIRIFVGSGVKLLHFTTDGLWLKSTLDSHECVVASGVSAFAHLYLEPGYLTPPPGSVGFRIDAFDNQIGKVVSYYTGVGMIVNGQYNQVEQAHLGGIAFGLHVTGNAAFSSFSQCYIDSAAVLIDNPWNIVFANGKFLHNTANPAFSFIVLKPSAVNTPINGLQIHGNSFHNIGAAVVGSVTVDGSSGGFDPAQISNCYIGENSFVNTVYSYTRFKTSLFQTASTNWVFALGAYLPFGNIQHALSSFLDSSGVNPISKISSVSGTTVTVTNSIAGNGTVFLEVDVNTGTS